MFRKVVMRLFESLLSPGHVRRPTHHRPRTGSPHLGVLADLQMGPLEAEARRRPGSCGSWRHKRDGGRDPSGVGGRSGALLLRRRECWSKSRSASRSDGAARVRAKRRPRRRTRLAGRETCAPSSPPPWRVRWNDWDVREMRAGAMI